MDWADRIGRRVKLRDIHVLLAVAQCGSMARAAQQLAVSQPVVSKVVADLEKTLGVRLLDRDRHGAEPTVYGHALLDRGIAAFNELRQGIKDIEFLLDPTGGEVRIGATDTMIAGLLSAVIDRLSRQYPRIVFRVVRVPTGLQHYQPLREHAVEILIGRIPQQITEPDLDVQVLFDEAVFVTAGIRNPWIRRRRIKLAELVDEPWVLPEPDHLIGMLTADLFHKSGLQLPKKAVICSSIQMNDALLATGRYLAIYAGSLLQMSVHKQSIKALPVKLPVPSSPVAIITLKDRTLSPVAHLFIKCARDISRPLARVVRNHKLSSLPPL